MPPAPDSGVVEVLGLAALSLTALNDALRAHMLQGAGLVEVAPQLDVLAAWLAIYFVLTLRLFRWR